MIAILSIKNIIVIHILKTVLQPCWLRYMPTHGSLTKAGKVRGQTPKIEGKPRSSLVSKSRNKNNFIKRFEKRRLPGQKKPERGGRR